MNKFIRATEIIMVAIITDYFFLLSICMYGRFFYTFDILFFILFPFLCSILFYMIIQSPSSKEKVAFNLFRIILLLALVKFLDIRFHGSDSQIMSFGYVLLVIFLDAVLSVLIFYLIGWWLTRKQLSVFLGIRRKRVVEVLLTSFMIITIPILLIGSWDYFDGSWSGTYVGKYSNDKVILDQHYFCYNDVVEADFKYGDGAIVLDIDSIRIKENSSDLYTDSEKQQMLDEIISLAESNGFHVATSHWDHSLYLYHNIKHFKILYPVPG